MKKILLASVALFGLAGGAMAADLPARRAAPVFTPVPVFTWTGFYIGVNAGYGFADSGRDYVDTTYGTFVHTGDDAGGFVGGGQVGFNYQAGMVVFGIEADAQYIDLNNNHRYTNANFDRIYSPTSLEFFGTVRGRIGLAFDRTLIYATGGFAYGGNGDDSYCSTYYSDCDEWRSGYTIGGGVEYAFTNNITAKIEGLYVNLDHVNRVNYYDDTLRVAYIGDRRDTDFAVIRAGLNFKFGSW